MRGRGPLEWASISARLQSETERSLADESGGPIAQLIPVPGDGGDGGEDDPGVKLKQDINGASGGALLVETMAARPWGEGRVGRAKERDWVSSRLGAKSSSVVTRGDYGAGLTSQMLAAFGCPAGLFADADSAGQRESYRRYYSATVEPLAIMLAAGADR